MSNVKSKKVKLKWNKGERRKAVFSECRTWRYHLEQVWDDSIPRLLWLMLNPSTADEKQNDPTVERCERRARMWGYGGVEIFNIFGYRATDPGDMKAFADSVGPDNDKWIETFALRSRDTVAICGWGEHGKHLNRGERVKALIRNSGGKVHALKINASGHPAHPLYIPYNTQPIPFDCGDQTLLPSEGTTRRE